MREYGKVHVSFWSSDTTRGMTDDGRMLALYLLTCHHNTIAGVFRLPDGYVCDDLQWSIGRVVKGFAELFRNGFANRCETTKWVWIVKHFDWNPPENPNQCKAVAKVAALVPDSCTWKARFVYESGRFWGEKSVAVIEPTANPFETLSKSETGAETESGEENKFPRPLEAEEDAFLKFWECWPKNERKQDKAKCLAKWKRENLTTHLETILKDVEAKKHLQKWQQGYIEAPLVYLTGRRWEDGVTESMSVPEPKFGSDEYFEFHRTASWWKEAGFGSVWEAVSSRCHHKNFHEFRNGQRIKEAA